MPLARLKKGGQHFRPNILDTFRYARTRFWHFGCVGVARACVLTSPAEPCRAGVSAGRLAGCAFAPCRLLLLSDVRLCWLDVRLRRHFPSACSTMTYLSGSLVGNRPEWPYCAPASTRAAWAAVSQWAAMVVAAACSLALIPAATRAVSVSPAVSATRRSCS